MAISLFLGFDRAGLKRLRITKNRGRFALAHHKIGSVLLVFDMILSLTVTYINSGKLVVSPHLWVGLGIVLLMSAGVALAPFMQQRNSQW